MLQSYAAMSQEQPNKMHRTGKKMVPNPLTQHTARNGATSSIFSLSSLGGHIEQRYAPVDLQLGESGMAQWVLLLSGV